ncbi:MAG: Xanthine dehydrogenase, FAD binding subunit [Anaerolineae bacterium]|nr:MAG: Xanthine dehydrogenase, FAD binding subunit [Anaerolineae bacterium]
MITALSGLPEFEYIKPLNLSEASRFLADHAGEARPFAGGTDVFVRMRDGIWKEKYLVDIKGLDGTKELSFDPQKGLKIGAGINMNQVMQNPDVRQHYPLLVEACRTVASYQLRTRATIVGNICNASPAGDTIGSCMVFRGELRVHGVDGWRTEPLSTFFLGPGKTRLTPGDVVASLHLPPPPPGCKGTYIKLGRNQMSDLAIVGVTVLGFPQADLPSGYCFRIALAAVAPTPLEAVAAEEYLAQHTITSETLSEAARLAQEACSPIDDVRGSARYRRAMVRNLTLKALTSVWQLLQTA